MTARLQIFADCPYGGCEDGYCACLERDIDEETDPDEIAELADVYGLLDEHVPERTVRRYCPVCGQVVDADEDNPDRVPGHDRFGDRVLTWCLGSDTRQRLEVAP
ncbi:hypothetical protein ACFY1J_31100 [Streptomyces sp. NPDC001406]|uniref:hypothetical protein n=1 Tax=Streptomyces sp. NPDC001406 TaxID=3364572 RepID=UPI0036A99402